MLPRGAIARLGTERFRQGNFVYGMCLSPDGKKLASIGGNPIIHIWDALTGKEIHHFASPWGMRAISFSPDGQVIVTAGQAGTQFWRLNADVPHRTLQTAPWRMAFSPDGMTLATVALEGRLALWDVTSGNEAILQDRRVIQGPTRLTTAVAYSRNGRLLASCGGSDICLWDPATQKEIRRLSGHKGTVSALAFSSDAKNSLASGGTDRSVRLWDLDTGKELRRMEGHSEAIESIAFAPDGKILASAQRKPEPRGSGRKA